MTSRPRRSCAFQLGQGELAQRVRDLVLARVTAVQVDHGGPFTVMPHPVLQLPEGRARRGGQRVPDMPQIMKMQAGRRTEPGCLVDSSGALA